MPKSSDFPDSVITLGAEMPSGEYYRIGNAITVKVMPSTRHAGKATYCFTCNVADCAHSRAVRRYSGHLLTTEAA